MRLVIRQNNHQVNEFRFSAGPVRIGRNVDNQIVLPEVKVSRRHAVLFQTPEGRWAVQDLNSANKTYLNGRPIQREFLAGGDSLQIGSFFIDIDTEQDAPAQEPIHLEDTLITDTRELQTVVRTTSNGKAPDLRLPAGRIGHFIDAAERICSANGLDAILDALLELAFDQFHAARVWAALRNDAIGPMTCNKGLNAKREEVGLGDISLNKKLDEALEKGEFLLFPRIPPNGDGHKTRSALVAPIRTANGTFGVLYIDNDRDAPPYTLADLDYLLLLAVHTAGIIENF